MYIVCLLLRLRDTITSLCKMAVNISVWDEVTKGNAAGQACWEVTCNHCGHAFVANATKIKNHLLASGGVKACKDCPEDVSTALRTAGAAKAAVQDAKKRTRDLQEELDENKKARVSGSPSTASSRQGGSSSSQGGIQRAFARANTGLAQAAVAKFFYTEGIPFLKVESSAFKEMVECIATDRNVSQRISAGASATCVCYS